MAVAYSIDDPSSILRFEHDGSPAAIPRERAIRALFGVSLAHYREALARLLDGDPPQGLDIDLLSTFARLRRERERFYAEAAAIELARSAPEPSDPDQTSLFSLFSSSKAAGLRRDPDRPVPGGAGYVRGLAGAALAAQKWSERERAAIDAAIELAARELEEFTADDVWARAPQVRVTKGLAGRLNAARNRGLIASTDRVAFASRGGAHDHRQRLAIWRSLIFAGDREEAS